MLGMKNRNEKEKERKKRKVNNFFFIQARKKDKSKPTKNDECNGYSRNFILEDRVRKRRRKVQISFATI